jgi:hypothetical protein
MENAADFVSGVFFRPYSSRTVLSILGDLQNQLAEVLAFKQHQ